MLPLFFAIFPGGNPPPPPGGHSAPEVSLSAAGAAVTLLVGLTVIAYDRIKRRR